MAEINRKMVCPVCRVEMNHHCDKVVYSTDLQQPSAIDLNLGGIVEEFHTCPKCGGGVSRLA